MVISAKVLMAAAATLLVAVASFATLGIVYSYCVRSLDEAGLNQAAGLIAAPTTRVEAFLEPFIQLNRAMQYAALDPLLQFRRPSDDVPTVWRQKWRQLLVFVAASQNFVLQAFNLQYADDSFAKVQEIAPGLWSYVTLDARNRVANGGVSLLEDEQYYVRNFTTVVPMVANAQSRRFESTAAAPFRAANKTRGGLRWFGPFYSVVPIMLTMSMSAALHNSSGHFVGVSNINVKIDEIGSLLRSLVGSDSTRTLFMFDQNAQIVATTHAESIFDESVVTNASAPVPANCFRTSSQSAQANATRQSCRRELTTFPYPPLQALARSNSSVLRTAGSVTEKLKAAGAAYYVSGRRVNVSVTDGAYFNLVAFIPEDEVLGAAKEGRNAAIGFSVAVIVVAVVLLVIVVVVILSPLSHVAETMERTANLDLSSDDDDVTDATDAAGAAARKARREAELRATSIVSEVAMLQVAQRKTKAQLKKLRAFVPQSVLARIDAELSGGDVDDDEGALELSEASKDSRSQDRSRTNSNVAGNGGDSFGTPSGAAPRQSSASLGSRKESLPHKGSMASTDSGGKSPVSAQLNLRDGLAQKRVTVAMANIVDFHKHVAGMSPAGVEGVLQHYIRTLLKEARDAKGVVDSVHGDRAFVSFNAVVPALNHSRRASQFALRVAEASGSLPVTIGVAGGTVLTGNVGTAEMRRHTIVGAVVRRACVLERLGKYFGQRVVVSSAVARDVEYEFVVRALDVLRFGGEELSVVYALLEQKKMDETTEWIYANSSKGASAGETAEDITGWNRAMELLASGNPEIAREVETVRTDGTGNAGLSAAFGAITARAANSNAANEASAYARPLVDFFDKVL